MFRIVRDHWERLETILPDRFDIWMELHISKHDFNAIIFSNFLKTIRVIGKSLEKVHCSLRNLKEFAKVFQCFKNLFDDSKLFNLGNTIWFWFGHEIQSHQSFVHNIWVLQINDMGKELDSIVLLDFLDILVISFSYSSNAYSTTFDDLDILLKSFSVFTGFSNSFKDLHNSTLFNCLLQ